jgi:hypothetical protein
MSSLLIIQVGTPAKPFIIQSNSMYALFIKNPLRVLFFFVVQRKKGRN